MRAGKPVVVHGDGTSLWTLTHADDFAVAFAGLLGNPAAIGEDFTITGTHAPTWNQIYSWLGARRPASPNRSSCTSRPSHRRVRPGLGAGPARRQGALDGVRLQQGVRPGAGFRTTIEYHDAAHEQIAWFDANPSAQQIDAEQDAIFDRLVKGARAF